jgi:glycosyltransferase involved in cell wall biosynthesis
LWSRWNEKNYSKIDAMLTIGERMAKSINAGFRNPLSITVIPIAVDTDYLKPMNKHVNPFCIENSLEDKFVVLYSGKMGIGHNIELILQVADRLKEYEDICFVFIGEGPKYALVEQYLASHSGENVKLFPLQPDDIFPYSMSCGDIGIVSQEASSAHLFMPSKTYSMMACGEAIVGICTDGDDLHILLKNQIGGAVLDRSPNTLANMILRFYKNTMLLEDYKKKAREQAVCQFDRRVITKKYREFFERLTIENEEME